MAAATVSILKQRLHKILKTEADGDAQIESARDCLEQLDSVAMTLDILSSTLIGATVMKFKSHDALGPTAKALIKKWKKIAKASEGTSDSKDCAAAKGDDGDKPWSNLTPMRQKICEKLFPLLLLAKSRLLEAGMSEEAVQQCLGHTAVEIETAINENFAGKTYSDKARSIAFNLKKNTELSQNLAFGAVTAEELVHMSAEQLAPADQQRQRAAQAKKLIDSKRLDWDQANEDKINEMCGIKGDLLKASLFTCFRCKSVKTTSTQKQTRSADEPMTVFVLCLNCGNRWKC